VRHFASGYLSWPQIDEAAGVIRVKRAKQRGKKCGEVIVHIEITPALSELIVRLRTARKDDCLYVFLNRYATNYTPAGFKTESSKLMNKLELKKIGRRFTFHDLRAYYVTRHKSERGALPDLHANPPSTARAYDRTKIVKRRGM
jgi:integrase